MTDHARSLMIAKLQVILQSCLVEIRNLALCKANGQIHDLADAVEFFPSLVLSWDDQQANLVRPSLLQYESKYPDSAKRYLGVLDMEEEQFIQIYHPERFQWDVDPAEGPVSGGEVGT